VWDLVEAGDLAAARVAADAALAAERSPEAHHAMGYVLSLEGDLAEALVHYDEAIACDEDFFEALLNAANLRLQLGDLHGAVHDASAALDSAEDEDEIACAVLALIDVNEAAGREEEVRALIAELPEGPFDSPALALEVGAVMLDAGELEAAREHIVPAAAELVGDPEAQYLLARLHEADGDRRAATAAYLTARSLLLRSPRPAWADSKERFEERVFEALGGLPGGLIEHVEGALVLVEEVPGVEVVSEGFDPYAPVLVDRVDLGKGETLVRVVVYQRNFEHGIVAAGTEDPLLRALLAEELDHYFG
jgi:tetratricopeptide (TPR) repeat protein